MALLVVTLETAAEDAGVVEAVVNPGGASHCVTLVTELYCQSGAGRGGGWGAGVNKIKEIGGGRDAELQCAHNTCSPTPRRQLPSTQQTRPPNQREGPIV